MKFELLAKRGAREILRKLGSKGELNFSELKDAVGSPTTASQRLQELQELGLIEREVQADRYRSVRYRLTKRGREADRLLDKLEGLLG